jgi:hypothetical protein
MSQELTHHQFRLLVIINSLADSQGVVETSVAHLGELTSTKSDSHVRASLKALEGHGYLVAQRRKRNLGKYTTSRYTLAPSPLQSLWQGTPPPLQRRTTTGTDGYVLKSISHKPLVPNTNKLISYENIKILKVSEDAMNRKWREEQEADESIGGIGKLDTEDTAESVPRNNPKTRGKRPQEHWTPRDVAAEFSFLVGRRFPWLPGTVNVHNLSGALAKMRKTHQTTALVELELLKMFMSDESNFKNVGNEAPHLYKVYLAMFRTHMNKARENLGLNRLGDMSEEPVVESTDMLYASDGTAFHNTLLGRNALERYEKKLNA